MNRKKKVFLALSGGVDSAVSAVLLKQEGYEVVGVFMKNWSGDDYGIQKDCPWEKDQRDAEEVCKTIGIGFMSVNFEKEYREKVISYFFEEYRKGRTPNPDVMCNKEIKFKLFFKKSLELGFDYIATGHYARKKFEVTEHKLLKGLDKNKDQSYFLYNINQEILSRTLFPIGELQKTEVRTLAQKFNLPNAYKPDSQGICFIGEINVLKFLMSKLPIKPGDIVDIDTMKKVGEHKGSYFYTIGQREGLGIGGQKVPYFVVAKDQEKNIIYVGHGQNHPALMKTIVKLESIHFVSEKYKKFFENNGFLKCEASTRYRQLPSPGTLLTENHQILFKFETPQRATAPGQSLVIYLSDECLGGGIIKE
ncbi:tRNA 2-thiouridine(34) synthase MnmA [Candidatus Dojkabacteria bacterium]|uniref:tRNA-specific 2-thiouridylase MnmA n=1 Tax=Candidatus Dojkabacteria bacterium TaxID=2099670 RepID=A0A3M0Z2L2_9BACT|nr:MAG: tRNA 2-thiouridine(34) synthase MnmA [Candidatus Dojkabacteria bacterium]